MSFRRFSWKQNKAALSYVEQMTEYEKTLETHVRFLAFTLSELIIRSRQLEEARYSDTPSHTMSVSQCVERVGSTVSTARRFIDSARKDIKNGQEDARNSTGDSKEA